MREIKASSSAVTQTSDLWDLLYCHEEAVWYLRSGCRG